MPRYKMTQYGLKQYGLYQESPPPGMNRHWQLVRARMGARLSDGTLRWVYQHSPVQFKGPANRLRLSTNTHDTILLGQLQLPGHHPTIRLAAPGTTPLVSRTLNEKGSGPIGLPT